ncbi:hypothetical protein BY454_1273 [Marinobacter persicus]|uniref:Uncharacterized protein n=2 Tax=Marinobacter persicus TaxID=930118 RepID=A0A2S6G437_9GAMM|nr:MAG: hypothetical protein AWU57_1314 [Marinobacter sp. T13-3]PPK50487.1 hypothetical protein BY455_12547 [Marinobacter persicus]PPK53769.1 hypothetical protein B0H24_102547 [Marinobacter persicus]PPK56960.1 hypothetical protein BY454_1273 [Marinobacter persicus]
MDAVEDLLERPKLKFVRIDQIDPVTIDEGALLEILTAPVPALKRGEGLTKLAVELATWLNPPLLYPQKGARRYGVQGNFRSVELCQGLPGDMKIPALVTSQPTGGLSVADLSNLTICTNIVTQGLDLSHSPQSLVQLIKLSNPDLLMALSPCFRSRTAMEEWLGVNRRLQLTDPKFASSPLGQQSFL